MTARIMTAKSRGYLYVLLAVTIFAGQDAFSKLLGEKYPPIMVVMVRFWAFALFVMVMAAMSPGGLKRAFVTRRPVLQAFRGVLLVGEVVVVVFALVTAGLAMSQAILQATPLIVTVLSVPLLGEKVGWRRGLAVLAGLFGVFVILDPLSVQFDLRLLVPLAAAFMYGFYSIATRAVSRDDSAMTSVLYAGVFGAIAATLVGPFYWTPIAPADWPAMIALCICGATSHYFLIKAYGLLTAVEVQPLTYLQLVFSGGVAVVFFGETVTVNMIVGAVIVVGAGLFTVWREHRVNLRSAR
ncbi:drug/metabolite transporter (DMT)-like permease [Rhizobium sp. PP-F2F-G48]|nr:drug/metabolite transporter (DMT)-like permease [Rhizobium sp. PP-F2F-G48]